MDQKERIRREIEDSSQRLVNSIEALELRYNSAKREVSQRMSPLYYVEKSPVKAVGASFAVGFLLAIMRA